MMPDDLMTKAEVEQWWDILDDYPGTIEIDKDHLRRTIRTALHWMAEAERLREERDVLIAKLPTTACLAAMRDAGLIPPETKGA